jgi:hypothetical protein
MPASLKSLRFAVLAAVGISSIAVAATTGSVSLSGVVASSRYVSVAQEAGATTLNLGGQGTNLSEQIVKVAEITLGTNNAEGLTLTASSGNLSQGSHNVAFKVITVADGAAAPLTAAFTVDSGDTYSYSNNVQGDEVRDMYISYDPPAMLDPGTYTATISLSVSDDS